MRNRIQILIFVSVVLLSGCVKRTKIVYQDKNVTVAFKDSFFILNVHSGNSSDSELTVCGKTYKRVRGYIPFYLTLPERNSILFVTGRNSMNNGQAIVHVVDLLTKKEVQIPAYDSHIGENIRTDIPATNAGQYEIIEKLDGDKLVIRAEGLLGSSSFRYYLDLKKSTFEKEEAEFRPSISGTTNHYIYLNGKRPFKL